ncbi:MAG: signal peptidase II [Candidatus Fermentithermobacillus carboniphilus]|uniref:Lipoprotein signal peptidase n=1 Tax=Candidatus Fermentithermobacillus carboniphilus TaxID=3085328 RepID=A0AAT9LES4_9FIRM|nr:MAG: signal peptidase II [Candidatus Fermentithermobacillus carboniphilus]
MIFWSVFSGVLILDQLTKWYVRSHFTFGQSRPILGDLLKITYWENPGAAFGLFPGATSFFVITSILSVIMSIIFYPKAEEYGWPVGVALGLISGGAMGNLLDRLRQGTVTDFISFRYFSPIFNLADSAIVVGAFVIGLVLLLSSKRQG